MVPHVIIYTDGSCSSDNIGGWAASLYSIDVAYHIGGNAIDTTNNRMELTAVIEALSCLTVPCTVLLYSDSRYVLDGICKHIANWVKNNWLTSNGKPVSNKDLWVKLIPLLQTHSVSAVWVKGHSGDIGNETVDSLANTLRYNH